MFYGLVPAKSACNFVPLSLPVSNGNQQGKDLSFPCKFDYPVVGEHKNHAKSQDYV